MNVNNSTQAKFMKGEMSVFGQVTGIIDETSSHMHTSTNPWRGIQFSFNSGSTAAGTIRAYGIKNS
jgi:hypothetical protein